MNAFMKELTVLDFLAQLINENKSEKDGYAGATHWLVTNHERQAECLQESQKMFDDWKAKELRQKMLRDELSASIKVIKVGDAK